MGFPIRRSLDQSSFAAPQGFSQRTTSFIASQRQGIHQMLLRHLITLMIDVRSAKTGHDLKKDLSLGFLQKTYFCLPSISGAHGCGPWLVRRTRLPAGRICRLFTISNIRAHPNRAGANLRQDPSHDGHRIRAHSPQGSDDHGIMVEPVGIEPTT